MSIVGLVSEVVVVYRFCFFGFCRIGFLFVNLFKDVRLALVASWFRRKFWFILWMYSLLVCEVLGCLEFLGVVFFGFSVVVGFDVVVGEEFFVWKKLFFVEFN